MEELVRSQKYDELAEYCEEEELKVGVKCDRHKVDSCTFIHMMGIN